MYNYLPSQAIDWSRRKEAFLSLENQRLEGNGNGEAHGKERESTFRRVEMQKRGPRYG